MSLLNLIENKLKIIEKNGVLGYKMLVGIDMMWRREYWI